MKMRSYCDKYHVGQRVSQQFPKSIQDTLSSNARLTEIITGTIVGIAESANGAFATIRQDDGKIRLVVLG